MDAVWRNRNVPRFPVSGGRGLTAETKTMNKIKKLFVGALTLAPLAVFADTTAPLDLSSTGTTIAGYIATAAGAGVAVLAGLYGVRVIIRAFKSVK
jgi:hypothetical protein